MSRLRFISFSSARCVVVLIVPQTIDNEGRHYECDLLPLMEVGSVAHKYYLLNIRLPVNERKKINVGIGEIKDIQVVVSKPQSCANTFLQKRIFLYGHWRSLFLPEHPSERRLHQSVVCHEDVPHAQHPHHHDLVLETDQPNEQTTGAAGEVSTFFSEGLICSVGRTSITSGAVPDWTGGGATELPHSHSGAIYLHLISTHDQHWHMRTSDWVWKGICTLYLCLGCRQFWVEI